MANHQQPIQPIDISPEEITWIKSCMNSKLLTYLIPTSMITLAGMSFATMRGQRFGLLAKAGLGTACYVVARLATIGPCLDAAEEQFPNGTLAATRKKAGVKPQSFFVREFPSGSESQEQMPSMDYSTPSRQPQPAPQPPSQFPPSASQQTYDDLRRRNRDQYTSRRMAPSPAEAPRDPAAGQYPPQQAPRPDETPYDSQYSQPISSSYTDPPSPYADNSPISTAHSDDVIPSKVRRRRVNVYGDEIED